MIYGYVTKNGQTPEIMSAAIQRYCCSHKLTLSKVVVDHENNGARWEERRLYDLIHHRCRTGDTLVVYDALSLGRSVARVVDVITTLSERQTTIHFVKYNMLFDGKTVFDSLDVMKLIMQFESDFTVSRTTAAMAGKPSRNKKVLRTPKASEARLLKLDQCRNMIQHYLDLGMSKAAIAKLAHCHPQTLRHYIDLRQLKSQWYVV